MVLHEILGVNCRRRCGGASASGLTAPGGSRSAPSRARFGIVDGAEGIKKVSPMSAACCPEQEEAMAPMGSTLVCWRFSLPPLLPLPLPLPEGLFTRIFFGEPAEAAEP